MPMQKNLYPKNWDETALRLKEQHNWTCERCGVQRGQLVKNRRGELVPAVITVAHPDHDPRNPWARLAVWCAQCHCRYDAHDRRRQRYRMRIARGQLVLPGFGSWDNPSLERKGARRQGRRAKK